MFLTELGRTILGSGKKKKQGKKNNEIYTVDLKKKKKRMEFEWREKERRGNKSFI